jgi:aspartate ammonia-lyase
VGGREVRHRTDLGPLSSGVYRVVAAGSQPGFPAKLEPVAAIPVRQIATEVAHDSTVLQLASTAGK